MKFKGNGFEIELAPRPLVTMASAPIAPKNLLSDEELLYWSSGDINS